MVVHSLLHSYYLQTAAALVLLRMHCMAFAKTPKRIRIAVLSVCFKIRLKRQVKKNLKFPITCCPTIFCLSFELSGIEPRSMAELQTTLTNKPKTQVKESIFYVYETITFRRVVNFHFPMIQIPFPYHDISSPKTLSVDLFCFSILMFTSLQSLPGGELKPTTDEKLRPQLWTYF